MGKHAEWRKIAKKLRRKRIRQAKAKERDKKLSEEQQKIENSPNYQRWLEDQANIEEQQEQEEVRQMALREQQWKEVEEVAQKQWLELQKKIAVAREEKMKQNMRIKLEWEREQQRLKELQEAKERELEEKRILQEKRDCDLQDFLDNGGDTPEHLKTQMETNPGKPTCPFFEKVSACRFFDACSRNHVRPGISRILLIPNFFTHYSLETTGNEHGTDSSLEYEKEDTYQYYKEFFYDVVSEMEKCGKIKIFRTCCNHESHLRGNVYVEYSSTREALVSYRKFNGRWFAGKQLNVEFCNMNNWNNAICGLHFKNCCPKGNSCNFLHVFKNPQNLYREQDSRRSRRREERESRRRWDEHDEHRWDSSERKNWRWSESPEYVPRNVTAHEDSERDRRSKKRSDKAKEEKKHRRRNKDRDRNRKHLNRKRKNRSRTRTPSTRKKRSMSESESPSTK